MTLDEWLTGEGYGAAHRLHLKAGVSLPVIGRACEGNASLSSATKIHLATGRRVPIATMTREAVPEIARKTKRARR